MCHSTWVDRLEVQRRDIINKKVLPSLGLENYMIRTFPVYEKWNPKKHIGEEKDSWGFLLQDKGMVNVFKKDT